MKTRNKVVLVNLPPNEFEGYASRGGTHPAMGLLLIGSLLKKNGFDVHLVDGAYDENYMEITENLVSDDLCYLGISVMTSQVGMALSLSKHIKKKFPGAKIVWGGPHPTLFSEQTVKNPNIDIIVINEGLETALELANKLSSNDDDISDVAGIAYKNDGNICVTQPRKLISFNNIPHIDFSIIDSFRYSSGKGEDGTLVYLYPDLLQSTEDIKVFPIVTGLGCAYKCTFCINAFLGLRYRYRNAQDIIAECKRLEKEYGANFFLFMDEDFFINKKRLLEMLDIMEAENLKFRWRVWCRVDHFNESYINRDLAKRLERNGLYNIVMGAECGTQFMLDYLKKQITIEEIRNSAEILKNTNIFPRYSFMVGFHNESMDDIIATYKLAYRLKKINPKIEVIIVLFRPYPGSPVYEDMVKQFKLSIPDSVEGWAEILSERTYLRPQDLPWVKNRFREIENIHIYLRPIMRKASYNFAERIGLPILKVLSSLRFEKHFFKFPIEPCLIRLYQRIRSSKLIIR